MIPNFNHNNVIPPHKGNPTQLSDVSPYECDINEFCTHFSTSSERIEILKGFVQFRIKMTQNGIINGYQWIDGSFSENIEVSENRPPKDIDVVSFIKGIAVNRFDEINSQFPEFSSPDKSKLAYKVDHYTVPYDHRPDLTVEYTRYWCQLFSHNRNGVWKGMLKIPLDATGIKDQEALDFLNSL